MTIKELLAKKPSSIVSKVKPEVMAKWDGKVSAEDEAHTIKILGVIGDDYDGGMTAVKMSEELERIGENPITVLINSPGGSIFEGVAIYNMLKEHGQTVKIKILGIAASAASVIALAGDEVLIAKSAFYMIHNAWLVVAGNRHDLIEVSEFLEPFDNAMAQIYSDFSGMPIKDVKNLMDNETYIPGNEAIELGFASGLIDSDKINYKDVNSKLTEKEQQGESLSKAEQTIARINQKAALDKLARVVSKLKQGDKL